MTAQRKEAAARPSGASRPGARLAIDIGGTFTDVVLEHGGGRTTAKVLTTKEQPELGFLAGVEVALERAGLGAGDIGFIVHGTTLATNALIERKGARLALICTQGFRDTLEIAHEHRFDQSDVFMQRPPPLVPRDMRFEVPERVGARGEVLLPLDEPAVRALIEQLRERAVDAVAVGLMHSYAHPAHEQRIRALIEEALPGVQVSLSSEVCPEIREYERISTTVANAYVQPLMQSYLARLRASLQQRGFTCPLLMIMSSGTMTTLETAQRFPIRLVESGPAGGAVLAVEVAAQAGRAQVLSFDMGGTTAKMCFIDDYVPQLSRSFEVARAHRFMKGSGIPVKIPVIEMVEIGAGGGSIGRVSELGVIAVGPDSAGSEPGPAAYGRGGEAPTVTDADVALGRIDPRHFADGKLALDTAAADTALSTHLARALAIDAVRAAAGISEMVEENMANATRIHAAEGGKDVSARTMIAFGGAAPLHAARMAEKLGIREVVIPTGAGVGSAIGFLRAPAAYELVRTRYMDLRRFDAAAINAMFGEMRTYAESIVRLAAPTGELVERRTAYMRYRGQGHEIAVPLPATALAGGDDAELVRRFDAEYTALFGRVIPGLTLEVVSWSLSVGTAYQRPDAAAVPVASRRVAPPLTRPVYDTRQSVWLDHGVHARADLRPGDRVEGPAVIWEAETTTIVSASFDAVVNALGYLVLVSKE